MIQKIVTLHNVPVCTTVKFCGPEDPEPETSSDMDHEIIAIPADDDHDTEGYHMTIGQRALQVLYGAMLIIMGTLIAQADGDGTLMVIMIPAGLWMMFTRKKLLW